MTSPDVLRARLRAAPDDLITELASRSATIDTVTDHRTRFHVRLNSPTGRLFAWYALGDAEVGVLQHELRVRSLVRGRSIAVPLPIATGRTWRIESFLPYPPPSGLGLEVAVAASGEIAALDLPPAPRTRAARARWAKVRRRTHLIFSELPLRDLRLARRYVYSSTLPRRTSHGDFHLAHLFLDGDRLWAIDWERTAKRPVGYDLMQLWVSLPGDEDRWLLRDAVDRRFDGHGRSELAKLRHALLVMRIASRLAEDPRFGSRDVADARRLLRMLPQARREAEAER